MVYTFFIIIIISAAQYVKINKIKKTCCKHTIIVNIEHKILLYD